MANIEFQSISLKNFLSFGNKETIVDLNTNDVTLIRGHNLDVGTEGYSRNGVGKSTIFQALTWVLFGEGITSIRQDDFINITNKKQMAIKLAFSVDDVQYELVRGRKPAKLELLRAGEPMTNDSINNLEKAIVELLGIDITLWLNAYMLTTNNTMFMNLKPAAQRDFIEKLLSLNVLSERADKIKTVVKDLKTDIRVEEQNKVNTESSNEKTLTSLETLIEKESTWHEDKQTQLSELEATRKEFAAIDYEQELNHHARFGEWSDQLHGISKHLSELSQQIDEYNSDIESAEAERKILDDGRCPYCEQKYADAREKSEGIERRITDIRESRIIPLTAAQSEEELEATAINKKMSEFLEAYPDLHPEDVLIEARAELDIIERDIERLKGETENPYTDQVDVLKDQIQEYDDSTLEDLSSTQTHCDLLVKLLTDSKSYIRKSLIEQYLSVINQTINATLDKIASPHEVIINPDLTVDVGYMGDRISFGNLSNGERLRVNVAVSFAFREVMRIFGVNVNCMFLDEILDNGGDASFLFNVFEMLQEDDGSVFLISHRDELVEVADHIMLITKKRGFSGVEIS